MKKILLILSIIIMVITTQRINAETLNCNIYLKKGSVGTEVRILQNMLNKSIDCNLNEDGIFGNLTKSCVIRFQKKYNLSTDGIVGPITCNKLNSLNNITNNLTNNNILEANKAIVIETLVNVRKGPSISYDAITQLKIGSKVTILEKKNNWYKVKLSSNKKGYIRSDLLSTSLIIVDISDQKLYYSKNGSLLLDAPVVTGNKGTNDTPVGSYVLKVYNKRTNINLIGINYNSHVNYWMPFIDNSIGFHDASWRTDNDYNNYTYTYNGSHGCINMQNNNAKILYENTIEDTAVIIRD